jgi:hypothetical protein
MPDLRAFKAEGACVSDLHFKDLLTALREKLL